MTGVEGMGQVTGVGGVVGRRGKRWRGDGWEVEGGEGVLGKGIEG